MRNTKVHPLEEAHIATNAGGLMKLAALFSILLVGCTTSYRVTGESRVGDVSFEEFQRDVAGYGDIMVRDSVIEAEILEVRRDSIHYRPLFQKSNRTVSLSDVSAVSYVNRFYGVLEWVAIGTASGAIIGYTISPPPESWGFPGPGSIIGGFVGAPAGLLVGFVVGHTYEYRLVYE